MSTGAPDYFKRILLYGLYEGVATPLACDEQGRLIFIPESVSPLYKSGTILLRDTFGDGLVHVRQYTSGTGATIALDGDEAHAGGYSCKLTGGSDASRMAYVLYYLHPSNLKKVGVEVAVRVDSDIATFEVELIAYTGSRWLQAKVRYNVSTQDWEIYDYTVSGYVAVLEDQAYHYNPNEFIPIKLVIDTEAEVYHKFLVAYEDIDVTAYDLNPADSTETQRLALKLTVVSTAGNNGYVMIDQVIVTQDES